MADAPRFGVTVEGVADVMAALKKKMREYPDAAGFALYRAGIRIQGPAQRRAPVEFGVLRSSAYVSAPRKAGQDLEVEMGFGTQYAAYQHEYEMNHPLGGEDHYLSNTVSEQVGTMLQYMGRDIDHAIKTGEKFGNIGGVPTRPALDAPMGKNSQKRKPHQIRNGRARFKKQLANVKARTGR